MNGYGTLLSYFLHNHILTPTNELILGFHNCLQELEIFHVTSMNLDAVHKVLNYFVVDLIAEGQVIFKDCANRFSFEDLENSKPLDNSRHFFLSKYYLRQDSGISQVACVTKLGSAGYLSKSSAETHGPIA